MTNAAATLDTGKRTYLHATVALDLAIRACEAVGVVYWAHAPGGDLWAVDYAQVAYRVSLEKGKANRRRVTLRRHSDGKHMAEAFVDVSARRTPEDAGLWSVLSVAGEENASEDDRTLDAIAAVVSDTDAARDAGYGVASDVRVAVELTDRAAIAAMHSADHAQRAIDAARDRVTAALRSAIDAGRAHDGLARRAVDMAATVPDSHALASAAQDAKNAAIATQRSLRENVDTCTALRARLDAMATFLAIGEDERRTGTERAALAVDAREHGSDWQPAIDAAQVWHGLRVARAALAERFAPRTGNAWTERDRLRDSLDAQVEFCASVLEGYVSERDAAAQAVSATQAPVDASTVVDGSGRYSERSRCPMAPRTTLAADVARACVDALADRSPVSGERYVIDYSTAARRYWPNGFTTGAGYGVGIVAAAVLAVGVLAGCAGTDRTDTAAQPTAAPVAPGPYAEDHPLFDCRVDGNDVCGPTALVPVPDVGGVLSYVPWQTAPAPLWRPDHAG